MIDDMFMMETPRPTLVIRANDGGARFSVLPLEPAVALADRTPALQLMIVEKRGELIQAFLNATVTLPMANDVLEKARQEIAARYPDVTDPQSIAFARQDITSCTASLRVDGDDRVVLAGSFQGVGEPRVMMYKQLSNQECDVARACWENGLPDAMIVYHFAIPKRRMVAFEAVMQEQTGIRSATAFVRTTGEDTICQIESPLGLSKADIRRGLIITKLPA